MYPVVLQRLLRRNASLAQGEGLFHLHRHDCALHVPRGHDLRAPRIRDRYGGDGVRVRPWHWYCRMQRLRIMTGIRSAVSVSYVLLTSFDYDYMLM